MERRSIYKCCYFAILMVLSLGLLNCGEASELLYETCSPNGATEICSCNGSSAYGKRVCGSGFWSSCMCDRAVDTGPTGGVGGVAFTPSATGGVGSITSGIGVIGGTNGIDIVDAAYDGGRVDASRFDNNAIDASAASDALVVSDTGAASDVIVANDASAANDALVAGDASDASDAVAGDASEAGDGIPPYGECFNDDECTGDNEVCYRAGEEVTVDTDTPGFCTVECRSDRQCPEPIDGTAEAVCSSYSSHCILDCSSIDCPTDMVCDDFGTISVCNYPES